MKENSQPLVILYGYRGKRNETNFIGRKGIITICGMGKEIQKILCFCNGLNSMQDIIKRISSISAKKSLNSCVSF